MPYGVPLKKNGDITWYYSFTWGKMDAPWPKQSRGKTAVDEMYNEILLYITLLHFEPIPTLRPRLPGNFTRSEISPEGCAQNFDSSRARLRWNIARNITFGYRYHLWLRAFDTGGYRNGSHVDWFVRTSRMLIFSCLWCAGRCPLGKSTCSACHLWNFLILKLFYWKTCCFVFLFPSHPA